jgi:MIP family channel proteins
MVRASIAEAVGTFILVFAGTSVVVSAALGRPIAGIPLNSLAVGLTFGLALAAIVAALGHVSGAHVNPAVTLALASVGRFPWKWVPGYLIGQFVGAIVASLLVWATFGDVARRMAFLGATYPSRVVVDGQAFLMEALITFILVFVILAVATDERANTATASLAIGFALGVAVLIGGPVSGGSANPARSLGPMIVAANFTGVWIYLIAPVVGGVVAAFAYDRYLRWAAPAKPEELTTVIGREQHAA